MRKVVLSEPVHGDAVERLHAAGLDVVAGEGLDTTAFAAALGTADAVGVRVRRIDAGLIAAAPRLKVIAKHGVGTDNIDHAAATARGIVVTNTPDANKISVAEHAMALMLALAKQLAGWDGAVRAGLWQGGKVAQPIELSGRTLAVLGFGRSGQELARRARAFDMRILAWGRTLDAAALAAVQATGFDDLHACLAAADVVSLHVPRVAGAPPLLGEREFAVMRPGALLVNCARGGVVDEAALAAALESGRLGGAGIDVFAAEPLPADHPLLGVPNLIASPHIAGVTSESMRRVGLEMAECILAALDGRLDAAHVVNRAVLQPDR